MKVLHFIPGSGVGGIERFVMDITSGEHEGIEYDFLVFARGTSAFVDCIQQRGTVHICRGWSLSTLKTTFRLFKKNHYDVVHAHLGCWSYIILLLAKIAGIKTRIAHSHSADSFRNMHGMGKLIYAFSRVLNPICVTHYLACSDHACACTFGKKIVASEKYTRILNPVDFNRIGVFDAERIQQLRIELGLRKNSRVVCNVGYLGKHKNQAFLLKQAGRPELKDVDFLLVGDGWNRSQLEGIIQDQHLENVHLVGIRTDVPDVLRVADVFTLPSILEGLGTVVLEAQACGTPCIISEHVTKETDLGMGLVQQVPLLDENAWVNEMRTVCRPVLDREDIIATFIEKKVELAACCRMLNQIYKG